MPSLVGSEMCIRDSHQGFRGQKAFCPLQLLSVFEEDKNGNPFTEKLGHQSRVLVRVDLREGVRPWRAIGEAEVKNHTNAHKVTTAVNILLHERLVTAKSPIQQPDVIHASIHRTEHDRQYCRSSISYFVYTWYVGICRYEIKPASYRSCLLYTSPSPRD